MIKYAILACLLTGCGLQGQINDLKDRTDNLEIRVTLIEDEMAADKERLLTLEGTSAATVATINALQTSINTALLELATIQGYKNIVDIVDPCGKTGNFDEILLKLSTGKYLASFSENSSGKNTRFTVLTDGNYSTTDGSSCAFTVSNNGTTLTW